MTCTDERNEFLWEIFTTACEGGINGWAEIDVYRPFKMNERGQHTRDFDYDTFYADVIDTEQVDKDNEPYRVDSDVIAKGIETFVDYLTSHGGQFPQDHYWRQFLAANRTNGTDGDYDAEVADAIVQFGLFGEIVYS